MKTEITNIRQIDAYDIQVVVDFIDGDKVLHTKSYTIQAGNYIESIYPAIKEDLNSFEQTKQKAQDLQDKIGILDLSAVKSVSELEAEAKEKEVTVQIASQEPNLTSSQPTE